jgi:predicted ATPase/DNA-binding SARP family transcriptional activator
VPVPIRSLRLQSLLAYLILHRQAPVARPYLAFQLWPVSTEAQALTNLRNLLHQLRQALPDAERCIAVDGQTLHWRPDAPAIVDVVRFEALVAEAAGRADAGDPTGAIARQREAERSYGGDLLPACYDDWIAPERERLRLAFLAALERLVELLAAAGDSAAAVPYAQRLVRHDPLHEDGYRQLLALYAATGDRVAALRTYQSCAAVLERELGLAPSPATQLAFERSQMAPADPQQASPPGPAANQLPVMLTRFIGRESDVADLRECLSRTRLLTLTGPGGAGKTRLALQLAGRRSAEPEADGRVWWVDLAPVSDPALVGSAWLTALDAPRSGEGSVAGAVAAHLGSAPALVVADNCEHVVAASSLLVEELLGRCPGLTVLATSREALGVAGEVTWPVQPLQLPERHWQATQLADSIPDAMALFVDRAAAVLPNFSLGPQNGAAIAAICRRVDGLPLAIELAAAAVRVMSVADIADRLEKTLELPPGRGRGLPDRHRTLAAAIDWSYGRLAGPEQALFRQLSVFAGGYSLDAASAIWLPAGTGEENLLKLLAQLVDKSLVTVGERQTRTEYRLLESLRQYGRLALAADSDAPSVHARHAAHFVSVVETDHPQVNRAEEARWLRRVEAVEDDIRAALGWCAEQGHAEAEMLARLATGMARYWQVRSQLGESERWLNQVLDVADSVSPPRRALALRESGAIATTVGQYDLAEGRLTACLALWQELGDGRNAAGAQAALAGLALCQSDYGAARRQAADGLEQFRAMDDPSGQATCLTILGVISQSQGDLDAARADHGEALALRRALGQAWLTADSLTYLAEVAVLQQDWPAARALSEQIDETCRALGDRKGLADAQYFRGRVAMAEGETDAARGMLLEVLAVRRELEDTWGIAACLQQLGQLEIDLSGTPAGMAYLREAIALFQEVGDALGLVECLEILAQVAAQSGDTAGAVQRWAAAAAWRSKSDSAPAAAEAEKHAAELAAARHALGDGPFAAAWAAGEDLSLDLALSLALAAR